MDSQEFLPLPTKNVRPPHVGRSWRWNTDEDNTLLSLVNLHGTYRSWSQIADGLPNRTGKQCRERYVNHLKPTVRKGDWTPEEDNIIIEQQAKLGNKWALITRLLPGRQDLDVKNRWHSVMRCK